MLTKEQNDLLTQTGPGTPGGNFMRCYWQPVALAEEMPPGGPPIPVRILGEDLVLFRDDDRLGLLGLRCSHRGVDLSYGRVEGGGLRCLYHGWLYDIAGRCLEQPGEPPESTFKDRIKHPAYPCREVGGLILTYMGPGEPPLVPGYEFFDVPEEQRWATKMLHEANYLQGNEANLDPSHVSALHRMQPGTIAAVERAQQATHAVRGSTTSRFAMYNADVAPLVELEDTRFGMRILQCLRPGPDQYFRRIGNFILPALATFASQTGAEGYSIHWHVPIDDTRHWMYRINFSRLGPVNKEYFNNQIAEELTPDYRFRRNASNRYRQDREEMQTSTFTGMGTYLQVHDAFAIETPGPIQDRTVEHLSTTDRAITRARQILLRGIQQVQDGGEAPHVMRDPAENRFPDLIVLAEVISSTEDWRTTWRQALEAGSPAGTASS